jgi:cobalt/nickel transport system permease protein
MIPDWLLRIEEYAPHADRDAFLDRTIVSLLGLLSRFRYRERGPQGIARINAGVGLGSTVLLVLLLSLSRDLLFVAFAGALLLSILSFCRGELIARILKTSLPIAAFTFLVMLPSAFWGRPQTLLMITTKVLVSVVAMKMLVSTVEWGAILGALRTFLPRLFIVVLDITTRYLVLLAELSLNMLYALKLRSVGRNRCKAPSLAGVAGTLYLKSRQMAEDTYAAMECRCFTGSYPVGRSARVSYRDSIPLALDALTVFVFFGLRTM